MSMFSQAERERIAATVAEVEQRTAGEIVVAEVARSDAYGEVRLFVAMLVSLSAAAAVHLALPGWPAGLVLAVQVGSGFATFFATAKGALLRAVLPRALADDAVNRAARLAFLQYGVFGTRDRTGVLIFLSELEHRVVLLGDEGIHARVQDVGWSALTETLIGSIKQGNAAEGVCQVITQLGVPLARDAPVRADDTNELSNEVRTR